MKSFLKSSAVLAASVFLLASVHTKAEPEVVVLEQCYDGDTCKNRERRFRLWGIDAAEMKQKGWMGKMAFDARERLRGLCIGAQVKVETLKNDHYGRSLVWMMCNDKAVSETLVSEGLVAVYPSRDGWPDRMTKLLGLQTEAQKLKRGMWLNEVELPSHFRRQQRRARRR